MESNRPTKAHDKQAMYFVSHNAICEMQGLTFMMCAKGRLRSQPMKGNFTDLFSTCVCYFSTITIKKVIYLQVNQIYIEAQIGL